MDYPVSTFTTSGKYINTLTDHTLYFPGNNVTFIYKVLGKILFSQGNNMKLTYIIYVYNVKTIPNIECLD